MYSLAILIMIYYYREKWSSSASEVYSYRHSYFIVNYLFQLIWNNYVNYSSLMFGFSHHVMMFWLSLPSYWLSVLWLMRVSKVLKIQTSRLINNYRLIPMKIKEQIWEASRAGCTWVRQGEADVVEEIFSYINQSPSHYYWGFSLSLYCPLR